MNVGGLIREDGFGGGSCPLAVAITSRARIPQASATSTTSTSTTIIPQPSVVHTEMSRKVCLAAALLALFCYADAQRRLALPDPKSCANRVRHATYRDGRGVLHSYFMSWEHAPTRSLEVDWLDARNICRRHCMDTVSLETPQHEIVLTVESRPQYSLEYSSRLAGCVIIELRHASAKIFMEKVSPPYLRDAKFMENEFVKQKIARGNVRYIWTSGRKCNFAGCDRPDLQPPNVNGWFWSGSGAKIGPTTQRNTGDWSYTGGYGQPQPDNREAAQPPNVNGWFWSGSGAKIGPTTQRNTGDWSYTGGYGQPQPDNREAAQGNDESCLSILNNFYNDGIKWHDVACHHVKPFICEDSDELLNFVRSRNPGLRI
ncbi:hypothetical protein RR48_08066 [Papilio machaon]|uniref:C-type lectin domain-containing protein n=1 Tax=Papilio machaon TaxID=76193 RepID=A0A194R3E5_PAPMA|nr:hypothetical protein RR48_08066 [Papilio machaon]